MHSETTFKSRSTFERMTLLDEGIKCSTGSLATKSKYSTKAPNLMSLVVNVFPSFQCFPYGFYFL
jgi:hypothetical protein